MSKGRLLVFLEGTEPYGAWLRRVRAASTKAGVPGLTSNHKLAEHALAELAARHGVGPPPPRMPPAGGPRPGSGRKPKPRPDPQADT